MDREGGATKSDEFSEKFQIEGGGSFSIQKFILHIWGLYKGFHLDVSEKELQYNFRKMRGGGSKAFGFFPKIHPIW